MDNRSIGIFDSGMGGLTAFKHLQKLAPNENIVFFGDTARVPYGTRTPDTITRYALEDISFLLSHDVKLVIAACGTVSSTLSSRFTDKMPVPFIGVINPTAKAAINTTKNGKVGILGTPATIKSQAFEREIKRMMPEAVTVAKACPMFVPLVENGYFGRDCAITIAIAREYLEPLMAADVDTIILGCTHYPIIRDVISDIVGDKVALIDSGFETARYALSLLDSKNMRNTAGGDCLIFTSDNPDGFSSNAEIYLGYPLADGAKKADLQITAIADCFK
ncbi:MAG: glutamate racemase [Oscillospiraceae bacterium]